MRCPFFEEMLVAFCRAYPVKKLIPSNRLQTDCICTCVGFEECPLFREMMARIEGRAATGPMTKQETGGETGPPAS